MRVTFTWKRLPGRSVRPPTIEEAMVTRLGRKPSDAELRDEVARILRESREERRDRHVRP